MMSVNMILLIKIKLILVLHTGFFKLQMHKKHFLVDLVQLMHKPAGGAMQFLTLYIHAANNGVLALKKHV